MQRMRITMTKPSEYFPTTVDEYLATVPDDGHKVLQKLRHIIKSIVPEAEERIAYRIPIFRLEHDLVGFSVQRNPQERLCSFYTMSPPLVKAIKKICTITKFQVQPFISHLRSHYLQRLLKKLCVQE